MNITLIILALSATASNTAIPKYEALDKSIYSDIPAISTISPLGIVCPSKPFVLDDEDNTNPTFPKPPYSFSAKVPPRPILKNGYWYFDDGRVIDAMSGKIYYPQPKSTVVSKIRNYFWNVSNNLSSLNSYSNNGDYSGVTPVIFSNGRNSGYFSQPAGAGTPILIHGF